jgi:hypothetical protein
MAAQDVMVRDMMGSSVRGSFSGIELGDTMAGYQYDAGGF